MQPSSSEPEWHPRCDLAKLNDFVSFTCIHSKNLNSIDKFKRTNFIFIDLDYQHSSSRRRPRTQIEGKL